MGSLKWQTPSACDDEVLTHGIYYKWNNDTTGVLVITRFRLLEMMREGGKLTYKKAFFGHGVLAYVYFANELYLDKNI